MKYIHRILTQELKLAAESFPAVLVSGPRRVGKTTLLQNAFPNASYVLLEDLDVIARCKADPRSFVEDLKCPVILDEIQNVPELFNYVRTLIDETPRLKGQWIFTGSQEAPLMRGVSESMAGRIAVFQLFPFSVMEKKDLSIFSGGFPEVVARPKTAHLWFNSYIQTYLERDVRSITAIKDLAVFRRFIAILASRAGSMLNKTDIAAPLGVSVPTVSEWLNILEVTGQIILVPPFFENFGKRLVKSPKIYFIDSGLNVHLLGIQSAEALPGSTFYGRIFEGFIAAEIVKYQVNKGQRKEIYYFRDRQGLEVDFLVPLGNRRLALFECKATRTLKPDMAKQMNALAKNIKGYTVERYVVYPENGRGKKDRVGSFIAEGCKAITVSQITDVLTS